METLYFNTWPQIFFDIFINKIKLHGFKVLIFLLLGISFFIIYKITINYINIKEKKQENKNKILSLLENEKNRLIQLEGKAFIKGFINYIEIFINKGEYSGINELLLQIGINKNDINIINEIIYKDENKNIEKTVKKIKNIFIDI